MSPRQIARTAAAVLIALVTHPHPVPSAPRPPGRWSPGQNWGQTAIHLNLMRGAGGDHSQILWWASHLPPDEVLGGFHGGLWGWNAVAADSQNCQVYPSAAFTDRTSAISGSPDSNIFCAGNVQLAHGLMVIGGTELNSPEHGGRFNRKFDPTLRQWSLLADMSERRWYPTGSILADGRALVSSGSQYGHLAIFGGRRASGGLAPDSLFRFGAVDGGKWDEPVVDALGGEEPGPREGHTLTQSTDKNVPFLFGGMDSDSVFQQDLHVLERHRSQVQTADYQYRWFELSRHISEPIGSQPTPRAEHSAFHLADGTMVIFGGRGLVSGQNAVFNDVWRVTRMTGNQRVWQQVTITSNHNPSGRFGHAMATLTRKATSPTAGDTLHLMLGGVGDLGQSPSDLKLWRLKFTAYATAAWETVAVQSAVRPAPRWDHTLLFDQALKRTSGCPDTLPLHASLVLFGGRGTFGAGAGDTLTNELWRLWYVAPDSLLWVKDTTRTNAPQPRGSHTASFDRSSRRMYVMGGQTASGADSGIYIATLSELGCISPNWTTMTSHHEQLTGHAAEFGLGGPIYSRISEIYSPATNSWSALSGSPLLQNWYPFLHLAPDSGHGSGGRVFYSGPSKDTFWWKEGDSPTWTKFPTTTASDAVAGGAAVMYRPGKVMKAGTGSGDSTMHGKTRIIDLINGSQWQNSGDMQARFNHNLVILANGEVMAVGGTASVGNLQTDGVWRPEIWSPDSGAAGAWYGAAGNDTLAADTLLRDYHSTAILLPDARVLCAGGNANQNTRILANVFCPPYLFTSGGAPAVRPVIDSAPQRIRYGKKFRICSPWNTNGQKPCLIRPGAATHGYDQNQRYVPLTVDATQSSGSQLIVTAPADSFIAPPGDYLLFILNASGVPAVARWVRLGSVWDMGDVTAPGAPSTFYPELASSTTLTMVVAAPGDDGSVGQPWEYELRWSADSLYNGNVTSVGTLVQDSLFLPGGAGTYQSTTITVPNSCAYYYYAIKTGDESGNWSAWTYSGRVRSSGCSEGCGPGGCEARADDMRDRREAPAAPGVGLRDPSPPTSTSAEATGTAQALVAVHGKEGSTTRWTLSRMPADQVPVLDAEDSSAVVVQSLVPGVGWVTRYSLPLYDNEIGVRSLIEPGRIVFVNGGSLKVFQALPGFELDAAHHSGTGDLARGGDSRAPLQPQVGEGDTLTLTYRASGADQPSRMDFFSVLPATGNPLRGRPTEQPGIVPLLFALHQNRPNPFVKNTTFSFSLPHAEHIRLEIFDLLGRRVRALADGRFEAGAHELGWDRRTSSGSLARPGIYLYRLRAGSNEARRRLIVLP